MCSTLSILFSFFSYTLLTGATGYCGADPARPDDLRQEWCWLWGQSEPGELPFSYQLLPNSNVPVALTTRRIRVSHKEQKWLHVGMCSLSRFAVLQIILQTLKSLHVLIALWRQLKVSLFFFTADGSDWEEPGRVYGSSPWLQRGC